MPLWPKRRRSLHLASWLCWRRRWLRSAAAATGVAAGMERTVAAEGGGPAAGSGPAALLRLSRQCHRSSTRLWRQLALSQQLLSS